MRATILNCTLKASPETSNTEALARVLVDAFEREDVEVGVVRVLDHDVAPGVTSDEGGGDQWPALHAKILASEILVIATPTWLGHISSVAQRVLERMDAMLSETGDDDRPVAYGRVAGFVVTGNEDGAHHCISQLAQGVIDIGFTVPGQAWTYWNKGPGPGPSYLESEEQDREWSATTGQTAAANLVAVARALQAGKLPVPVS